jgi:hypothetical protein
MHKKIFYGSAVIASAVMMLTFASPALAASTTKSAERVCVKTASVRKDNTLKAAVRTFKASEGLAVGTWMQAIKDARALAQGSSQREAAVKKAGTDLKASMDLARKTLKATEKSARETFRTGARACMTSQS